jgi:uncharacterized protein (TIGR04222 family)
MSILDLRGPEFLQSFFTLFLFLIGACAVFRWLMAGPHHDHPSHEPQLDPLEVAYLSGGARAAVGAAVASLVHRGALRVRGSAPPRLRVAADLADDVPPLEAAVYGAAVTTHEPTIRQVRTAVAEEAERLSRRLEEYDFLLDPVRRTVCHVLPVVAMAALLALGVAKIAIGLSRGRPVLFLVFLCLLVTAAAAGFALRYPRRTWRGTRLLNRLKREHAALHATASVSPSRLGYADLALAFALYGPVVLSMGPLADLQPALKPRREGGSSCSGGGCGGSSGSSCGGGGGGGGCGGGGCGGCGGGGS